jgi:hypothetical protein
MATTSPNKELSLGSSSDVLIGGGLFCERVFFIHTRGREEEEVYPQHSKGSYVSLK